MNFLNVNTYYNNTANFTQHGKRTFGIVSEKHAPEVLELFKKISERIDRFVDHCYHTSYPDAERAERLHSRWHNVIMRETEKGEDSIAYIVNKDYELRVCVTDKVTRKPEDLNTAMFVVIHELAHMISYSYGHNDEFWNNFKLLLKEAIKEGIYSYQNYSAEQEKYCGITIHSTPCSDSSCSH